MKNKDMFLINESENEASSESQSNSRERLEEVIVNLVTSIGFILALVLISVNVNASQYHQNSVRLSDVKQGSLLYKTNNNDYYQLGLILNTQVDMTVSGMVVRTKVKQSFKNDSTEWLEGLYVFPLPEAAAIDHMKLTIGERVIEGKIKEKKDAQRIYRQARQNGSKAALIEQQRANLFTNLIANIAPGEIVTVEIEYQQILKFENKQFSLRFPTTLTRRYVAHESMQNQRSEFSSQAIKQQQLAPAVMLAPQNSENKNNISIHIDLNAGFPISEISSAYHKIESISHIQGHYTISLVNEVVSANRDFEVSWKPELGNVPQAVIFSEQTQQKNYYLVMVMPPEPKSSDTQVFARDVTYIIDTSGSMHGESIIQAKAALQFALTRLRDFDKFNVIAFNSTTAQLFLNSQLANTQNLILAKNYVTALEAAGGTEMKPALEAAFDMNSNPEYIRQIIFLTDGSVSNETELFKIIKTRLNNSRLFTVAIGSAPNSYFMSKAAKFGRGSYTYIGKTTEVQTKMAGLFSKIEKPVLLDVKIKWPNKLSPETWPKRLPDLYAGEPLIFTTRIKANSVDLSQSVLQLSGKRNGQEWQQELTLDSSQDNYGIAVLWARNKIAALMDGIHDSKIAATAPTRRSDIIHGIKQKIIELALSFHLVSRYTSLVAIDSSPSRPLLRGLSKVAIPNSTPRGSQQDLIQGQYAQTATTWKIQVFIGLLLLLLAALVFIMPSRLLTRRDVFANEI